MYKIRVILDSKEDVIRTILVDENLNLEALHFIISKSFGFKGKEMASFYRADKQWNQGEEIPLFNMSETGQGISMQTCVLQEVLPTEESKLFYVYDFLRMWTFYVDVVEISKQKEEELPKTIFSLGEVPSKAPQREFTADGFYYELNDDDDLNQDFNSFDDFNF